VLTRHCADVVRLVCASAAMLGLPLGPDAARLLSSAAARALSVATSTQSPKLKVRACCVWGGVFVCRASREESDARVAFGRRVMCGRVESPAQPSPVGELVIILAVCQGIMGHHGV
jgi:hypothetical protein